MPIVVVDKERCLESERAKVNSMIQEYDINPNADIAKQIVQKVKNNGNTSIDFAQDINRKIFEMVQKYVLSKPNNKNTDEEQITAEDELKDLKENYEQTTAEERKTEVSRIRTIYRSIEQIVEKKGEDR